MDFSGGLQIRDGAWIPMNLVTPAKPVPMRPQPNAQGNQVGRYSLLEGIGCPAGYMQGNPPVANGTAMLLNSMNQQQEFNSWETALTGKKRDAAQISGSYQQAMNNVAAGWNNIPCSNLLALADAASRTPSSTRQRASNFAAARRIFPFAYTPESSQQQLNGLPLDHIQAESSWQQSNCLPYGLTQAESRWQQSNRVPFVHNQDGSRQQQSKVVPFTPSQAESFQQQWNVFPFAQTQVESNKQLSKNLPFAHNQAGSSSSSRQQSNVLPSTNSQVENCRQQSNAVPVAHTQAESSQQQSNMLNMLPQSQHDAAGTNQSNSNCQAQIPQYGFPVPYRTMYGLNDQPRTMAGAVSNGSINFQFEPITPDKARNEQARYEQTSQPSGMLNKFFDDRLPVERQMLPNGVNLVGGKTVELHCQESQLQSEVNSFPTAPDPLPAGDSTYAPLSAPLEANHNSNKGQVEIDLNTPPQQKPKRKKIRPRVVKEGKPKRTPKSTEKQASPKENQPPKRKYVRRNGNKASNTSPNAAEEIPKPNTGSTVNSCKRSLNFNTGSQEESRSSNCNLKMDVPSNLDSRSGRVAFDGISEAEGLNCRSKDTTGNQSTLQLAGGLEVVVENTSAGFAFDLNHSLTQMLEEYITLPEQPTPTTPPFSKSGPSNEKLKALRTERYEADIVGDYSYSRSRIQEAFSSSLFPVKSVETNDSAISSMSNPSFHSASMILHNSTCGQNLRLAEGEHQSISKRGHSHNPEEAFLQSLNLVGSYVDSSKAYSEILQRHEHHRQVSNFGLQYPDTCKKRRVEKSQKTVTKSALMVLGDGSRVDTSIGAFIPQGHDRGLGAQLFHANGTESLQNGGNNSVHEDYLQSLGMKKVHYMQSSPVELHLHNKMPSGAKHAKVQTSDFMLTCQTERMAMKRSKGATQVQDFASLTAISQCNNTPSAEPSRNSSSGGKQGLGLCHSSESFLGTLAHDKCARMELYKDDYTTPAIGNRKSYSNRNEVGMQETQTVVYSDDHSLAKSKGPAEVMVSSPVDEIIQKLSSLNINDKSSTLLAHEQQALVPYTANGQMVLFDPTKKRKPRAKVDLDPETDRVWKLLMGKERDNSDDKTDADKEKWWEQERQTFHGRAMSFIARMHLIQGDRRFLKWNGSVVDSVVGVFLTQNVSDHLSSSAFMALAAHFPLKSRSDNKTCDGAYMYVEEPEACIIDSNETTREPISNENCTTFHKGQQVDYRQTDNSNEILGSNAREGSGVDITNCKEPFISECTPDMRPASNDNIPEMHRSSIECANLIIEDRKLVEVHSPVVSSQGSVDSSTNISAGTTSIGSPRLLESEERGALEELASSQNSHADEIVRSCSESNSDDDHGFSTTSFMDLLRMQDRALLQEYISQENGSLSLDIHSEICCERPKAMEFDKRESNSDIPITSGNYSICVTPSSAVFEVECPEVPSSAEVTEIKELDSTSLQDKSDRTKLQGALPSFPDALDDAGTKRRNNVEQQARSDLLNPSVETLEVVESTIPINCQKPIENKVAEKERFYASGRVSTDTNIKAGNSGTKPEKEKRKEHDWDSLRKEVYHRCGRRERSHETMDSLDWEAVRCADVNEIAKTIKERGMNNMLAERIKAFLNRLVRDHESIDLEWLRDVPPDKAKEYLLSVRGLGLKSVECIRLLTLHNLAFPVDTNVGRIAVRLGWVPLQPLPESLQLHLLELYPIQESIQKYLWPRLCTLDQKTLYELHYQLITFGKVFCTKSKPNCNACPMRAECRHFASAFASARLALPGPEEKGIVGSETPITSDQSYHSSTVNVNPMSLPAPETKTVSETRSKISDREPIIEVPASPEPVTEINDIEDFEDYDDYEEDPDEIPTIELNIKEFRTNLENYIQENNMELQEVAMSNALVALTPQAASIPTPKLKNVSRLRTEHQVYELPDTHTLLNGVAKRVPGEVCYYLLAIWAPGETAESTQPPERCCSSEVGDGLCNKKTCFSCNSAREATSQTVRGTLLIPCKTAMRGSFPLNGTYFQVNEVFADHESSVNPIDVPRDLLWDLPRRTVYFGTSIPSIFKGQTTEEIQSCFWRGYVCLRGFDQKTRAPKPLQPRLHFPASRQLQLQKLKQEQEQLKSKNS